MQLNKPAKGIISFFKNKQIKKGSVGRFLPVIFGGKKQAV